MSEIKNTCDHEEFYVCDQLATQAKEIEGLRGALGFMIIAQCVACDECNECNEPCDIILQGTKDIENLPNLDHWKSLAERTLKDTKSDPEKK